MFALLSTFHLQTIITFHFPQCVYWYIDIPIQLDSVDRQLLNSILTFSYLDRVQRQLQWHGVLIFSFCFLPMSQPHPMHEAHHIRVTRARPITTRHKQHVTSAKRLLLISQKPSRSSAVPMVMTSSQRPGIEHHLSSTVSGQGTSIMTCQAMT